MKVRLVLGGLILSLMSSASLVAALAPAAGGNAPLQVTELDGSPRAAGVYKLKVSNGTLTNNGSGVVTIATALDQSVARTWTANQSFTQDVLLASGSLLTWNNDIVIYRVNANSIGIGNADASELRDLHARNCALLGTFSQTDSSSNNDIRGTIANNASGTNRFAGNLAVAGLAGSGSRTVLADANGLLAAPVSDARLKLNLQPLDKQIDALAILRRVQVFSFNYNQSRMQRLGLGDFGAQREYGFTYQNLAPLLPEAVGLYKNGFGFVKYAAMVAYLLEVNKQLLDRLERLERSVRRSVRRRR